MEKDIQELTQNERYDLKRKQLKEEWNKMTQEITQEERLDLTTDKIKAEKLAYSIELFKNLEAITKGSAIIDVKGLYAENQRLKEQLKDYEKALKKYAKYKPYEIYLRGEENPDGTIIPMKKEILWNGKLAVETLKKWEK